MPGHVLRLHTALQQGVDLAAGVDASLGGLWADDLDKLKAGPRG